MPGATDQMPEDRYVFIHIPKTAGTSIRDAMTRVLPEEDVSPGFPVCPIGTREADALDRYRVIAGHISWLDVRAHFRSRRAFTFLRDPVDRCLSLYGFFRGLTQYPHIPLEEIRGTNSPAEAVSLARQLEPEDFFRAQHPHLRQNLENRMTWQLGYHAGAERRGRVPPERVLEQAIRNLEGFLFVGFFERLDEDLPQLVTLLGAEDTSPAAVPNLNRTASRPRVQDITAAAEREIRRLTELDRRLYDAALAMKR